VDQDRRSVEIELLVVRCQRGERSAFEELFQAWEPRLFFYIRRLVKTEEETWGILQEVWLQVLRGVTSLRDPRLLPVWLYKVARNTVMSHHRREYARERSIDAHEPRVAVDERAPIELDNVDMVQYGLSRLPRGDREVLTLFFLRDLSINEVAEVLDVPAGTVKSRLHKAKKALREALEREGDSHD